MDFDFQWLLLALPIAFALGWIASRLDVRQWKRELREQPRFIDEAAQSRFDVDDGNRFLDGNQRTSDCRVDITDDQHGRRVLGIDDRLESTHNLRGLNRVGCRSDPEIDLRRADAERIQILLIHRSVIVLSRVHDARRYRRTRCGEPCHDGRDLHEIGPCADYAEQPTALARLTDGHDPSRLS